MKSESSHPTREKLKGTPFENVKELDNARKKIVDEEWCRIEQQRARNVLMNKEEYQFLLTPYREGFGCSYKENQNKLLHLFIGEDNSIQLSIDQSMKDAPINANLLAALLRTMGTSFLESFLKTIGSLPHFSELSSHEIQQIRGLLDNVTKINSTRKQNKEI